jgi:hypothetical protein
MYIFYPPLFFPEVKWVSPGCEVICCSHTGAWPSWQPVLFLVTDMSLNEQLPTRSLFHRETTFLSLLSVPSVLPVIIPPLQKCRCLKAVLSLACCVLHTPICECVLTLLWVIRLEPQGHFWCFCLKRSVICQFFLYTSVTLSACFLSATSFLGHLSLKPPNHSFSS